MNTVLEKFVEAELYNEGIRACFNGFTAYDDETFGRQFKRMRQVQLDPYGIADIVNIFYPDRESKSLVIQVIECKRDVVSLSTYAQAKRYLSALRLALAPFVSWCEDAGVRVRWECILVGRRLEKTSDFIFVLNDDPSCHVFTYQPDDGELLFVKQGRNWGYHHTAPHPVHGTLNARIEAGFNVAWERSEADFEDYYSKYDKAGNPL